MSATKARMGRPPLGDRARAAIFTLRLSAEERDALDAAAERAGKPVTKWARDALLMVARSGKIDDGMSSGQREKEFDQ